MSEIFLVGLTGGIGSGKSAAAEQFASMGVHCVDADVASRAVVAPGQPALEKIATHFGSSILQSDGTLDRAQLRHKVFAEPTQRKWLQSLLHPLISRWLREQLRAAESAYAMLINPLLIESGQTAWCHRVLVLDVPEALQISRTMSRDNNTAVQVQNIINAQASRAERLAHADDVLVNDRDLAHLRAEVTRLHRSYLQQCLNLPA